MLSLRYGNWDLGAKGLTLLLEEATMAHWLSSSHLVQTGTLGEEGVGCRGQVEVRANCVRDSDLISGSRKSHIYVFRMGMKYPEWV